MLLIHTYIPHHRSNGPRFSSQIIYFHILPIYLRSKRSGAAVTFNCPYHIHWGFHWSELPRYTYPPTHKPYRHILRAQAMYLSILHWCTRSWGLDPAWLYELLPAPKYMVRVIDTALTQFSTTPQANQVPFQQTGLIFSSTHIWMRSTRVYLAPLHQQPFA